MENWPSARLLCQCFWLSRHDKPQYRRAPTSFSMWRDGMLRRGWGATRRTRTRGRSGGHSTMTSRPRDRGRRQTSEAVRACLLGYRRRLMELLRQANREESPAAPSVLAAVSELAEDLTLDLLRLYRRAEADSLERDEARVLIPTLEALRDVLRTRPRRSAPVGDFLQRALDRIPPVSTTRLSANL